MIAAAPLNASRILREYGWSLLGSERLPFNVDQATSVWVDQTGTLEVRRIKGVEAAHFLLRFFGEDFAAVDATNRQIWLCPESERLQSTTSVHILLDQVLPRVLAHEGHLVLHSGAVELDRKALLILGDSGFGKSTLTAHLGQAAGTVLSDDAMLINEDDGAAAVQPVYPGLRLLPDSRAALFAGQSGSPVAEYTDKVRVAVPLPRQPGPVNLAMMVVLGHPDLAGDLEMTRLTPIEGCMAMIRNSFALDPADRTRATARLRRLSAIAFQVPMFSLNYPRAFHRLPEVLSAVREIFERQGGTSSDRTHR